MKTLELTVDGVTVNLQIRHATAGDALRREMLASLATENPLPEAADQLVATVFYPRCVACTTGRVTWTGHTRLVTEPESQALSEQPAEDLEARDLTPAEFVALPAEIFDAWWEAVIEQTPGWALRKRATPEQLENPNPNS